MKIEFKNYCAKYKKSDVILHNFSLCINSGEMIAIIGKSGAGKSTFFNAILNALKITSGSLFINDKDINHYSKKEKKKMLKKIGFLSQENFLLEDENVYESILRTYSKYKNWFYELFKIINKKQQIEIFNVLDELDIFDKSFSVIKSLSSGQKQRVEIAKLLLKNVDLILADEPTSNLDINTSNDVIEILKNINKEKKTTILVNIHNIDLAKKHFQKYIAIKNGNIVSIGNICDLTNDNINFIYDINKKENK